MLTKPNIQDQEIVICLQDDYALDVDKISFLPLGADLNTAVYRITTSRAKEYFLKLRNGEFLEASVSVPKHLADLGMKQVIPPIATKTRQLWASLGSFKAILYPFVEGHNAMEVNMSDQQWIEFGATMQRFHKVDIPQAITHGVPRETFSSTWRERVKTFLGRIEHEAFKEPIAERMSLFLKAKTDEILKIIKRAENLAHKLHKQPLLYILCHGDIHGWNLLLDHEGDLYVVDWDTLIFAPKERDLMFISAGLGDSGKTPLEEKNLFYQGYGQTEINHDAIAYYRFERIIEDIAVYCEQIFLSDEGEEDRLQSFEYLQSNFRPGGTIERAYHSDM